MKQLKKTIGQRIPGSGDGRNCQTVAHRRKLLDRLHDTSGESLGEVLAAVLVTALAALMLATMVVSSSRLVTRSENRIDSLYSQKSTLEARSASKSGQGTISVYPLTKNAGEEETYSKKLGSGEITAFGDTVLKEQKVTFYGTSGEDQLESYAQNQN